MYKYYKKGNYDIMYYYFDSIAEYLDYLSTTPTSNVFNGQELSSMETNNNEWAGTKSLEEAINLAKYGYCKNFERFITLKLELEKYIKISSQRPKQYNYYIGYAPDVKAYLEGSPLSMLNKINPSKKEINIYFNTSFRGDTNISQIYNRGIIVLSMIEILEKLGFIVNLNIFEMSYEYKSIHFSAFRLKNSTERANIRKLYFPMCHSSWIRRLNFRLIEVTPNINDDWTGGYGTPAGECYIRQIIDLKPNDIVIPEPIDIGIMGNDLVKDANSVFKYINDTRHTEDFELPHLEKKLKL